MSKKSKIELVVFHGFELETFLVDGIPYVVAKTVAEAMGLTWRKQHRLITQDRILKKGITVMGIPSNGGDQDALCIQVRKMPLWLCKIPSSRYKDAEVRERIELFQDECGDALAEYWLNGGALNPRATPQQVQALQDELSSWMPIVTYGAISKRTGMPRTQARRSTWVSPRRKKSDPNQLLLFGVSS